MNKNWLELIEKKYDEIINVGEKAYKDALENQHLRFIVEMDENGNVYSWYDVAGGNSFHASTYNGESIELLSSVCNTGRITQRTKQLRKS